MRYSNCQKFNTIYKTPCTKLQYIIELSPYLCPDTWSDCTGGHLPAPHWGNTGSQGLEQGGSRSWSWLRRPATWAGGPSFCWGSPPPSVCKRREIIKVSQFTSTTKASKLMTTKTFTCYWIKRQRKVWKNHEVLYFFFLVTEIVSDKTKILQSTRSQRT